MVVISWKLQWRPSSTLALSRRSTCFLSNVLSEPFLFANEALMKNFSEWKQFRFIVLDLKDYEMASRCKGKRCGVYYLEKCIKGTSICFDSLFKTCVMRSVSFLLTWYSCFSQNCLFTSWENIALDDDASQSVICFVFQKTIWKN